MVPRYWQTVVARVLREGADFGRGDPLGERISLEFGSANPTGPLVVVQGRSLSIGATLANALRFVGYDVTTEWIINDAGAQLDRLGRSLYARYRQTVGAGVPVSRGWLPGRLPAPDRAGAARNRRRALARRAGGRMAAVLQPLRPRQDRCGPTRDGAPLRRRVRQLAEREGAARRGRDRGGDRAAARARPDVREGRRAVGPHRRPTATKTIASSSAPTAGRHTMPTTSPIIIRSSRTAPTA